MSPDQRIARAKRVVAAARGLVSGEMGFAHGAKRIVDLLWLLGVDAKREFPAFGRFLDSIPPDVPLAHARLVCTPALLRDGDERLAAVEAQHREAVLFAAVAVVTAYSRLAKGDDRNAG